MRSQHLAGGQVLRRLQHFVHVEQAVGITALYPHVNMSQSSLDHSRDNRRPYLVGSAADLERNAVAEACAQDFVGERFRPISRAGTSRQKIVILEEKNAGTALHMNATHLVGDRGRSPQPAQAAALGLVERPDGTEAAVPRATPTAQQRGGSKIP